LKVFIDTSAFCALTIPKDQHNFIAKSIYKRIQTDKAILYTSDYVLDEVYTLLKNRSSHATAVKFMNQMDKCSMTILRVNEDIEKDAKTIFKKFDDRRLSFTDCTSFALINQLNIDAVFAFDEHFKYHPYAHPIKILR
jgi:predicted nucleic acid-binding protein